MEPKSPVQSEKLHIDSFLFVYRQQYRLYQNLAQMRQTDTRIDFCKFSRQPSGMWGLQTF